MGRQGRGRQRNPSLHMLLNLVPFKISVLATKVNYTMYRLSCVMWIFQDLSKASALLSTTRDPSPDKMTWYKIQSFKICKLLETSKGEVGNKALVACNRQMRDDSKFDVPMHTHSWRSEITKGRFPEDTLLNMSWSNQISMIVEKYFPIYRMFSD